MTHPRTQHLKDILDQFVSLLFISYFTLSIRDVLYKTIPQELLAVKEIESQYPLLPHDIDPVLSWVGFAL